MSQQYQQEQLECLPSEIPPAAPWLPILVIHIRSQVKTRQSQSYKFKKLPKIKILQFCKNLYTRHTFWGCLIRCMNMKGIQPEPWALQSWHGMQDGMRDGRTDGVKPIYPPTTSLCRGYNNEHGELTLSDIAIFRDHFWYAPSQMSQWQTTLHCNVISHWLGAYTKWSLILFVQVSMR